MLKRVLSGGQCGADLAGLITAKKFGIPTGGWIPKGFITQLGKHPEYAELYNIQEHSSPLYPPRTFQNAKESDGTIRFAYDLNSAGEKCTLKAILQYKKPYIDVNLHNSIPHQEVVDWIITNNIQILNIAGNSEKTYGGITFVVQEYLEEIFKLLGYSYV